MRRAVMLLPLVLATTASSAPPTPAQAVKYRHEMMEIAGHHMSALSMITKGESDRVGDLVFHAQGLNDVAKVAGALFPEGSGPAPGLETESKAEIWTSKDKFAAAVKLFEDESAKLVTAAKTGDLAQVKSALGAVGGSCGDCHDSFRVEEKD